MQPRNLDPIVAAIKATVDRHRLAPGSYARYLWQNPQNNRTLGEEPYGCADAVNLLYTISDFPRDLAERQACIDHLRGLQQPDGFFRSVDHHYFHTTAHCTAALELFDAAPLRRPQVPAELLSPDRLETFLADLDWDHDPWDQSHIGAGLYVLVNLNGLATPEWNRRYFQWLWDNADPETGYWRGPLGHINSQKPMMHFLAGTFHYLFNHEYARQPLHYPERLIDSAIDLYDSQLANGRFGQTVGFSEIDWIFCLTRAMRQTPYRFQDIMNRLEKHAEHSLDWWFTADFETDEGLNDLHRLFGGVCALAELQQVLRGKLLSFRPLRLVMDRRPFI